MAVLLCVGERRFSHARVNLNLERLSVSIRYRHYMTLYSYYYCNYYSFSYFTFIPRSRQAELLRQDTSDHGLHTYEYSST